MSLIVNDDVRRLQICCVISAAENSAFSTQAKRQHPEQPHFVIGKQTIDSGQ